jgi:CRP/FNR family transcriptional regulator, cyclic AMP receptor protein
MKGTTKMADRDPKVQMLAKVPIFSGLSEHQLSDITRLLTPVDVKAGTTIARQGEYGKEFFVIISGTASVVRDGVQLAKLGAGDVVGEISIIDGGQRTASVVADTDLLVEVATHPEFAGLLDRAPEIAVKMLPTLAALIRNYAGHVH